MFRIIAPLAIAAMLITYATARASEQSQGVLFICAGKIEADDNGFHIYDPDTFSTCEILLGQISRRVLRTCSVGEDCTISAKGSGGHGVVTIERIFEVQKTPPIEPAK
jgi:hypothetical protein